MQTKSKGRRLWRGLVGIGLGGAFAFVAMVPTVAAASNPVHTTASSTYTAVPSKGVVDVSVTLKVKNNVANGSQSVACSKPVWDDWLGWTYVPGTCKQTINYYVNQSYLWVENDATHVKVTSNGGSVKLTKATSTNIDFKSYKLTFPRIFKGQTRTITATYTIKSGAPRSAAVTQINGAYLNFGAITQPVDTASVKVVVPSTFGSATWGGAVKTSTSGKQTVYSSGNVDDPTKFWVGIHGTNPTGFDMASVVSAGGRQIDIESWPGDTAWRDAVKSAASDSISALEGLVGRPISENGPVTIREVAGGELGDAYVGQYETAGQLASVSEQFEQPGVVSHELAHAWFNGAMFDSTWMSEGHAEWAAQAVGLTATPCVASADKVDLGKWQFAAPRSTAAERGTVAAQYATACAIVADAANRIGTEGMKNVFTVLSTDAGAYPGTLDAKAGAPNSWRQWLDAVDEQGMAPAGPFDDSSITDNLVKYGIATSADLTARSAARVELADLRQAAGTNWTIPSAVYAPMGTWDFPTATEAMSETTTTIADVEEVAHALPSVTVDANPIRARVAAASTLSDLTSVRDLAATQRTTADELATTIDRTHKLNPIEAVGLIGTDVGATSSQAVSSVANLDLDAAKAKTGEIDGALHGAATVGLIRLLVVAAGLAVVSIIVWRRRRGDPDTHGTALANDVPMTSAESAPGLAAVRFDDRPTI